MSGHTRTYAPSRCVRPSTPKSTSDSSNTCFLHFDNIPSWLKKMYVFSDMDLCFSMKAKDESLAYQVTCFGKENSSLINLVRSPAFSSFSKVLVLEPNVCIISAVYCHSYIF